MAAVLGSALLFAVATVLVKFLTQRGLSVYTIAFGRFALGAVLLTVWFAARRRWPKPRRWSLLFGRAIGNTVAVLLFYEAIHLTTVTKANVLNMTYPLFVAIGGPLFLGERTAGRHLWALAVGGIGIWLVIHPRWGGVQLGDWVGLACGIAAAGAILVLRRARAYDASDTIVWFLMVCGVVALMPAAPAIAGAGRGTVLLWLSAAACGVGGQLLITFGYRFVSAIDGSIASSARIFFAGALGTFFFGDPLTWRLLLGAGLILVSIYAVGRAAVDAT